MRTTSLSLLTVTMICTASGMAVAAEPARAAATTAAPESKSEPETGPWIKRYRPTRNQLELGLGG